MKSTGRILPLVFIAAALAGCSLAAPPKARSGLLDLRGISGAAPLVGEWLVTANGASRTEFVPLRSGFAFSPSASAESWSLNVLVPSPGEYALVVPFPREVAEIYSGETPLLSRGTPGMNGPRIVRFQAENSALIRVEIPGAGRSPGRPALSPAPYLLGSAEAVASFQTLAATLAGVEMGAYCAALLVALMFAFVSRHGKEFLAFAAYVAGAALFCAIKDSFALVHIPVSLDLLDRFYSGALSVRNLGFILLALALFPESLRGAARIVALALPVLLAAAAFVPALPLNLVYAATFGFGVLLSVILAVYVGIKAARGHTWLLICLFAQLALLASYSARWVAADSLFTALVVESAGVALFLLLSGSTIVGKVGDIFKEADSLSVYLGSMETTVKRFIPVEFMEYLQKTKITDLRLGDHVEKEMTIFFSDIRAFTQLSEDLTPEENFAFINSYLARMVPLIKERGGFVDKYIGDAIMALFPDKGGADQALRTALDMQKRVVEYNRHRASVGYRPIEMGIGIHTGTLMLGVVGVQDRMENTVISDAVNLSSRLQSIAKAFDIGVVISEQSFKSLDDAGLFKYRFIGKVRVKGKAAPVSCFEIFDDLQDDTFELKMKANTFFEQGMLSYYQKEFIDAVYYFKRALEILPRDGAARFYLETCLRKTH